jgi:hypothetical protein
MNPTSASMLAWLTLYSSLALLAGIMLLLAMLLMVQIVRGKERRRRAAVSAALGPVLHQALVQFLAGSEDESVIRQYAPTHPQQVTEAILSFQFTVSGSGRDRLLGLVYDLGLVHQWCDDAMSRDVVRRREALARLAFASGHDPSRRIASATLVQALKDADEEVRLSAARGLAQTSIPYQLDEVFGLALGPNRLTRVVLTEELRRHAVSLSERVLPGVLASDRIEYVKAALEIVTGWGRAIPLERMTEFLDHRDAEIRLLALKLAAVAAPDAGSRAGILRALNDEVDGVRLQAADTVARLKMNNALAHLAQAMRRGPIEIARAAAKAMTHIQPMGQQTLEELAAGGPGTARQAASEILARGKVTL